MHHKNLLTIKDTLLSSQTSHPHNNPHTQPCRNHHKATRPTLPHQPRNHKTAIPKANQQNQPPPRTTQTTPSSPRRPAKHYTHPTTNANPAPLAINTPNQRPFNRSHATSSVLTNPGPLADLPAGSSLLHLPFRGFLAPPEHATFGQHVGNASTPSERRGR